MNLLEQAIDLRKRSRKIIAENPGATNVWWTIENVPMSEINAAIETLRESHSHIEPFSYSDFFKCLVVQVNYLLPYDGKADNCTIFAHSVKVAKKEPSYIEA